jgi:uncharacterized protein
MASEYPLTRNISTHVFETGIQQDWLDATGVERQRAKDQSKEGPMGPCAFDGLKMRLNFLPIATALLLLPAWPPPAQDSPADSDTPVAEIGTAATQEKFYSDAAQKLSPRNRAVRELLFANYLGLSRFEKARGIYPVLFSVGAGALLAMFAAGLSVLLTKSFKIGAADAPGLLFSSAWLLFYMVGQTACMFLVGLIHPASDMGNFSTGAMLGSVPVLVALAFAFRRQPWGGPFAWPSSLPGKQLGLAAAGFFLVMAVNVLYVTVYTILAGHPPAPERSLHIVEGMMRSHPAPTCAFVVLIGPVVEETLFRGLLFGSLQKHLRLWTIPVTAVVFGAFHLDAVYFFPVTVLGLLLAWFRWKSGSIWLPAILHMMINGLAVSVLWLKLQIGS